MTFFDKKPCLQNSKQRYLDIDKMADLLVTQFVKYNDKRQTIFFGEHDAKKPNLKNNKKFRNII